MLTHHMTLNSRDLDSLQAALRGERAATDTYELALRTIDEAVLRIALFRLRDSHFQRAEQIESHLRRLAVEAQPGTGLWGTFIHLVDGKSAPLGLHAALDILRGGEQATLTDYERCLEKAHGHLRAFYKEELVPEQRRTVAAIEHLLPEASEDGS